MAVNTRIVVLGNSVSSGQHFLLRITRLLALLLPSLCSRCSSVTGPPAIPPQSLSRWMSTIQGTKQLSELSIPGSHDSCAQREWFPATAKCQVLSISDQLSAGVRFLDIRCRNVHNKFEVFHGPIDQKISFQTVLSTCLEFLKIHPSECVILSVQEESCPIASTRTFEQVFDSYVNANKDQWYLDGTIPTLDEARGHLVLLRRFTAIDLPKGIPAEPCAWQDDATFWIRHSIRVQDNYIVKDNGLKWCAIQYLYQEAQTIGPNALFLNFTSGYKPGLFGIPNIKDVSNNINLELASYFQHSKRGRFGITIMDFADSQICTLIIATNR
jgi:1-phosphatidylinositol phosphodiesterase